MRNLESRSTIFFEVGQLHSILQALEQNMVPKNSKNDHLCFTTYVFTGYGRFFPQKVLVNVLTFLFCRNQFFFEKKLPNFKNLKFRKFWSIFDLILTNFYELSFDTYFFAFLWPIFSEKNFGACFNIIV